MKRYLRMQSAAVITALSLIAGMIPAAGNVNVSEAARKAKPGFTSTKLYVGQKKKITIKNKLKKAVYTYKSSAPKKASVSKSGVITAKSVGKARITIKQKYKKNTKSIGKITVSVLKKKEQTKATEAAASAQQSAACGGATVVPVTEAPKASAAAETAVPSTVPTPEPTEDVYTKEILTIHTTDTRLYTVDGNTCKVDMQYFTGSADSEYFSGNIKKESSNVIKRYKEGYNDGRTISTARYILEGKDAKGNNCTIFIEDNSIDYNDDSHIITKPTIVTNNSELSWLQTADVQGRVENEGDGDKTIHIMWNESNGEKLPYPTVKMPDTSRKYTRELFTFNIGIGPSDGVSGDDGASASMIYFNCSSNSNTFKGEGVETNNTFADTRIQFKGQVQTLSARYILDGTDDEGNECRVYIENNGIDNGEMVTEPTIITDNPKWAWIETAPLHGTVSWETGLTIHMWTTADAE